MIHQQLPTALTRSEQEPPRSGHREGYFESLVMRLYDNDRSRQRLLPTIGVTSGIHGEGVSTVAAQLAIHAAMSISDPVLLLKVAAGRSSGDRSLGTSEPAGLSEVLSGREAVADCIQPTRIDNLSVLGAGTCGNGWGSFQPQWIDRVLREIRDAFAFVVVDLPPANEEGPCLAVAGQLDGVLLTIEAEGVSCQATQRAKQQLLHAGANLLGVILNKRREHIPRWLRRRR